MIKYTYNKDIMNSMLYASQKFNVLDVPCHSSPTNSQTRSEVRGVVRIGLRRGVDGGEALQVTDRHFAAILEKMTER